MKSIRFCVAVLTVLLAVSLTGCGDGGDGSSSTGLLNLSITDVPVDEATSVVVQFTGVEIQPETGERLSFDFDTPRQIDLLALNSGGSELLLDGVSVPAGHYNWIRLKVDAACGVLDSYIEIDSSMNPLWIPSGSQTGLKLVQGFDVPAGGVADFTIDFDLRKSVHNPQGQGGCSGDYMLKPALRIVDNTEVGSIGGTVDSALINDLSCTSGNAVYVFEDHGVTPDDVDGSDPDPITSTIVKRDDTGEYVYKAAFLSAGDYTVAFTCQAWDDDPETDDIINFEGTANVTVSAGVETTHNFQ